MRFLKVIVLTLLILAALPTAGRAIGIDIAPIVAKLTEQLTQMTKDYKEFQKISTAAQDQIDAIGRVGKISLPLLNAAKIGSQIKQDLQCLKPDFSKLMPNVDFEEMDWASVCQAIPGYKKTLWLDPSQLKDYTDQVERLDAIKAVAQRREAVLDDAATKGLAHADIAAKEVDRTNKAIDDLSSAVKSASNQNERLAAIGQGQVVLARATAQQTQILAQMLKIQSAFIIKASLPIEAQKIALEKAGAGEGGAK